MTTRTDEVCADHPRKPAPFRRALPDGTTEPICAACYRLDHPQVARWVRHRHLGFLRRDGGGMRPVYRSTYQDDRGAVGTVLTMWDGQNYRVLPEEPADLAPHAARPV